VPAGKGKNGTKEEKKKEKGEEKGIS